jgi:hypothetical protein
VTTPGGTSALVTVDHFRYSPTVTGLSPAKGPASGKTKVTITGSGFATGTTGTVFHFGAGKATAVSCVSSTECTATNPAHAAGTVEVRALVNGVGSGVESGNKYVYE